MCDRCIAETSSPDDRVQFYSGRVTFSGRGAGMWASAFSDHLEDAAMRVKAEMTCDLLGLSKPRPVRSIWWKFRMWMSDFFESLSIWVLPG